MQTGAFALHQGQSLRGDAPATPQNGSSDTGAGRGRIRPPQRRRASRSNSTSSHNVSKAFRMVMISIPTAHVFTWLGCYGVEQRRFVIRSLYTVAAPTSLGIIFFRNSYSACVANVARALRPGKSNLMSWPCAKLRAFRCGPIASEHRSGRFFGLRNRRASMPQSLE